jgi:hypothetical protein
LFPKTLVAKLGLKIISPEEDEMVFKSIERLSTVIAPDVKLPPRVNTSVVVL